MAREFGRFDEVEWGPELERILAVELRDPPDSRSSEAKEAVEFFTRRLSNVPLPYPFRKPSDRLFPAQALFLQEVLEHRRGLGPITVGGGKMLLCYLLFVVLGAKRPLYLLPKSMEAETRREVLKYSADWGHGLLPASKISYLSYEKLSSPSSAARFDGQGKLEKLSILQRMHPDVIVADEAHKLSNRSSIGWKRLDEYLSSSKAIFIPVSGSFFRESIDQIAHISHAALGDDSPLPNDFEERLQWRSALDRKVVGARTEWGALLELLDGSSRRAILDLEPDEQHAAMCAEVGRRFLHTPGVVGSNGDPLGIPLTVDARWVADPDATIDAEITAMIEGSDSRPKWSLPDGELIIDGMALARHRHTLERGYWARPEPAPPPEYQAAKSAWAKAARDRLKHNRLKIDSEANLKAAIREGSFPDLEEVLRAWDEAQAEYTRRTGLREPPSVAQWVSDEIVHEVARWLDEVGTGIVWTPYIPLGEKLSRELKLPYFGAGKCDATGRPIFDLKRGERCIAAIKSCGTGTNLQHFHSKGLWLGSPTEQPLGRTHRPGQPADRVENWVYLPGLMSHARYWKAYDDAKGFATPVSHNPAKLVLATSDIPLQAPLAGPRWAPHGKVLKDD